MKKFLDFTASKKASFFLNSSKSLAAGALVREAKWSDKIKDKILSGLKAQKYTQINWFSSRSEAVNAIMIHMMLEESVKSGKNQILLESGSCRTLMEFAKACKNFNMQASLVGYDKQAQTSLESLADKLGPKSVLMSSRLVHPVLGTFNEQYTQISSLLLDKNIAFHLDITGAFGSVFSDLETLEADFLTLDLESFSSLKGTVVFSKKPLKNSFISPQSIALDEWETLLQVFETIYEQASADMLKLLTLKMHLMKALKEQLPFVGSVFESCYQNHNAICLSMPDIHQDALSFFLLKDNIQLELGGQEEMRLHELIKSLGHSSQYALSCFTMILSKDLTEQDCDEFVKSLHKAYLILKKGIL